MFKRTTAITGTVLAGMIWLCGCLAEAPVGAKMSMGNATIDAMDALRQAAEDKDPAVRSNAIEALSQTAGVKEGGLYLQALSDENVAVQFAAGLAVGDTRYEPAKQRLLEMAAKEGPDRRVYCAVIYALFRLGDKSHLADLGRLLAHKEAEVRTDAALVLGKSGVLAARVPLKGALQIEQTPMVVIQLVESLSMLGDLDAQTRLEAYARQRVMDMQLVAIPAIGRTRPDSAFIVLNELLADKQIVAVRVAAASALAMLGSYNAKNYLFCAEAAENPAALLMKSYGNARPVTTSEVAATQRLGAIALGYMNRQAGVDVLHPLLRHPDGSIRVAAAMSILRLAGSIPVRTYENPLPTPPKNVFNEEPPPSHGPKLKMQTAGDKD